jgi:hypothetical protein
MNPPCRRTTGPISDTFDKLNHASLITHYAPANNMLRSRNVLRGGARSAKRVNPRTSRNNTVHVNVADAPNRT